MRVENANAISLSAILDKIGINPAKRRGYELWYFSPFRTEKTPSFHVHLAKNCWYDFGASRGGNVIDFVCAYLQSQNEDHTCVDALRWLQNVNPSLSLEAFSHEEKFEYGTKLELRKVSALQHRLLLKYLKSRGISSSLAKKYLKEVHVRNLNTGKTFYAIGLRNESGGYELRNEFFKGCIAPKDISFIRGSKLLHDEIHVFEGVTDFLSALASRNITRFEGDAIILNSLSCLQQSFPYIRNYTYRTLYTWLDNDEAGKKARKVFDEFAKKEGSLIHVPMNETYDGYKDVNAWHMHKLA